MVADHIADHGRLVLQEYGSLDPQLEVSIRFVNHRWPGRKFLGAVSTRRRAFLDVPQDAEVLPAVGTA